MGGVVRDISKRGMCNCKGTQACESVRYLRWSGDKNQEQEKAIPYSIRIVEFLGKREGLLPCKVMFHDKSFGLCPEELMNNEQ